MASKKTNTTPAPFCVIQCGEHTYIVHQNVVVFGAGTIEIAATMEILTQPLPLELLK